MNYRYIIFFAIILPPVGCVSFSGLDPKSDYSNIGSETIIVLRVTPRYRIHIFKGERIDQKWNKDNIMAKLNTFPEDGYIVAKITARTGVENYGVGGILPEGIGGRMFAPCRGQKTLTFSAPSGKVVYVGDIKLIDDGSTIRYEASSDVEAARAHLKTRYPLLADKLIDGGYEGMELVAGPCPGDPTVPMIIMIPMRVR